MSKPLKIMSFKGCQSCINKCSQDDENLQVYFFYNRKNIKNIDDVFNEELRDNIKFHILWFLDDKNCTLALTKAKDLSQAVEKIIDEIKTSIEK